MKLLQHLPPPEMPKPFSWQDWKKNISGKVTICRECDDHYRMTCSDCRGSGHVECCECGSEKECKPCNGNGKITCEECNGEYRWEKYIHSIASDYRRLLEFRQIHVTEAETIAIATDAAWYLPSYTRGVA